MTRREANHTSKAGSSGSASASAADKPPEPRLAKLRILDKEVTIACRPGEEDALKQAAAYIDQSMRDLRSRNNTSSIEKIAIVTAINTADALLKSRANNGDDPRILNRIEAMNQRLAGALEQGVADVDATASENSVKNED